MRPLFIAIFFFISLQAQPLLFPQKTAEGYGFVNAEGDWVISPRFDKATTFKGKYSLVKEKGLWGMIDEDGDYRIRPRFQKLQHLSSGLILAQNEQGLYGYVNSLGLEQIEFQFDKAISFSGKTARVKKDRQWNLINRQGKKLLPQNVDRIQSFKNTHYLIENKKLYGLASNKGSILLEQKYQQIKALSSDILLLTDQNKKLSLYHIRQKKLLHYQTVKILRRQRILLVQKEDKWGVLDYRGTTITRPMIDEIFPFKEQRALIRIDQTYGFLSQRGKIVIAPNYSKAQDYDKGQALVQEENKWFFIDKKGRKITIKPEKEEKVAKLTKVKKKKKKIRRDYDDDKEDYRSRVRSSYYYSSPYYGYTRRPYYHRSYCPPRRYYNGVHLSTNIGGVRVHYHRNKPIKIKIK